MGESRGASGFLAYANELTMLTFARGALQKRGSCGRAERALSPTAAFRSHSAREG